MHLQSKMQPFTIDSSFQRPSGMLTGNGQAAGDVDPLPLSALCDVACFDALMMSCTQPVASQYLLGAFLLWLLRASAF